MLIGLRRNRSIFVEHFTAKIALPPTFQQISRDYKDFLLLVSHDGVRPFWPNKVPKTEERWKAGRREGSSLVP